MKIKEYSHVKNFICENQLTAMAWADYHTNNNDTCFINGTAYIVKRINDSFVRFKDGSHMVGDLIKYTNIKTNGSLYMEQNHAKEIRDNNKINEHYIVFNKEQLNGDMDILNSLMEYIMPVKA